MVAKTTKEKTKERRSEPQPRTQSKTTKVLAVTVDSILEGNIRHQTRQSLPNVLNNGLSIGSTKNAKQVVPLTDVKILQADGEEEHKKTARVKKAEVLFFIEAGNEPVNGNRSRSSSRNGRNHKAVLTKVCTSGHDLVGKMEATARENWTEITEGTEAFVSLADVEIMPKLPNGEWKAVSVVINRAHVTSVEEPKITPPDVEMTLVRIIKHSEKVEADSPVDLPDLESHAPEAQVQDA